MLSNREDIPRARLIFLKIAEELLPAKGTRVSKTGEEKAMQSLQGFTAFLSSSYPPLSIHFLQPSFAATELKDLKPSVGVTYCSRELVRLANSDCENNTPQRYEHTFKMRSKFYPLVESLIFLCSFGQSGR